MDWNETTIRVLAELHTLKDAPVVRHFRYPGAAALDAVVKLVFLKNFIKKGKSPCRISQWILRGKCPFAFNLFTYWK